MIIHLHFHPRITGITKSIEGIIPFLSNYSAVKVFGYGIKAERIGIMSLLKHAYGNNRLIIHAHRNNEIIFALLIRFLGGKFRLFATRHSESEPSGFTVYLMKKVDVLIALTRSMAEKLPVKSVIVRHGINTDDYIPGEGKIPGVSQENLVSVVARVRPSKGQADVLEAMIPLLQHNPEWGLLLIGKIDHRRYAKRLVSVAGQNRVARQVHLISSVKQIHDYYHASNAVVIASPSEGFSLVCIEALSCGLITVATEAVGIHSEIISHDENGFLYPYGDISKLRSILSAIINGKVKLNSEKIRQNIVDNWNISRSARMLAEAYGLLDN